MYNIKKISAAALCAAMSLSLAGCGNNLFGSDTSYAAVIDGTEIPAGIFISMQMDAYYEAMYYTDPTEEEETEETTAEAADEADSAETTAAVTEAEVTTTTAFTDKVIEGKAVRDWINDEATKSMQEYVAIENKFDELGLSFEDNEDEKVTIYMDSLWEYYGSMYEELGISENSEILITLNSQKRSSIFDYYYGEGGESEISEDEIKAYLTDNNARINYIEMELRDGEGNLLKSDGKAEIMEMAEGYIERIKNGEDMNTVGAEYEAYYNALVEAASESDDDSTVTVDMSEADDDEAEAAVTDNTTIITKDGSLPSSAVAEKVFDGSVTTGDVFLVEEDEVYYIVEYLDLFSDETYLENNDSTVRHTLKDDEFDEMVSSWTENQTVEINEAAYKRYKIEKFM